MNKPQFVVGNTYHIYNRGVDKREIFLDDDDRFRFIHDLYEFNDSGPASHIAYRTPFFKSSEVKPPKIGTKAPRDMLVHVLVFCLMPNHFHLVLQETRKDGIVQFMKKIGTGYTMYFNNRYERSGTLFESTYKVAHIASDAHLVHIPYYVHLNPLDLHCHSWRERNIQDYKDALKFLDSYRWSSFLDYCGRKNFPSVTQRDSLMDFYGGSPAEYRKQIAQWLRDIDTSSLDSVIIEKS